jgi:hypothetical protein
MTSQPRTQALSTTRVVERAWVRGCDIIWCDVNFILIIRGTYDLASFIREGAKV